MKPQRRKLQLFGPNRTTIKRTVEIRDPFGSDIRLLDDVEVIDRTAGGQGTVAAGRNSCGGAEVQRWLGVRWYGVPWPKRLRLKQPRNGRRAKWLPIWIIQSPGCGCIVKLKALTQGLKHTARAVWRA